MHQALPARKTVRSHSTTALIALFVGNVALAFGPWFVRLSDVGPVAAGFWRLALAAPILLVLAQLGGNRPLASAKGLWWVLTIAGIAFAADLASWHAGIHLTTLANSTLFGNSATLVFPIYGFFAARTWPNRYQALALLLAAIGAGLLMGRSVSLSHAHLVGDLLCLLAGILYAVYFVLMARAREAMAPLPALALSSLASIPVLLIAAIALGEQVVPGVWWPLFALALLSQVLGQGCMIYALGHLSPLVIGIALLIQPIVSGTIGWIVYGERLGAADLTGAVLVAVALVLVRRSPKLAPDAEAARAED